MVVAQEKITICCRQVKPLAPPRGAVLVLVLLVLALFSLVAVWWVVRAGLQQAGAGEYQRTLTARTAADSALEHAKVAVAGVTQLAAAADSGWVALSSSKAEQVWYRVNVRDTATVPAQELPWPALMARRASPIVRTATGWRRSVDPQAASHQRVCEVATAALGEHAVDAVHADALALALADAYDDNFALAEGTTPAAGFEGLAFAAAQRGDDHLIPVNQILRQSAFYDLDYQRDNFAIFGAFSIDAVEPVVASAQRTNTRIRLTTRLADPARQRQWETFQHLWHEVYPERFIPHAWRGQRALIVTECGGASTALTLLDNDGEWLYFEGYPLDACARGRFVSINLCSLNAQPGCLTAVARGVPDVWFVTGLLEQVEYRLTWYADGRAAQPEMSVVLGTAARRAQETLVHAVRGAAGFQMVLAPDIRLSYVHVSRPDVVAWRYTGTQPLQVSGWRWQRRMPEHVFDTVSIISNAPAEALVLPGTFWAWSAMPEAAGPQGSVISFVAPEEAGCACIVQRAALEPSPYGGWAWRITARVHPDFRWSPGYWRGAACVRACDSNLIARSAFLVVDNTHDTLVVHAGTRATADTFAPAPGTWLRLGGLLDAMRRADSTLINPFGQNCACHTPLRTRPPAGMWAHYDGRRWRSGAGPAVLALPTNTTASARVRTSPAWQHITAHTRDADLLAATLDRFISPHGMHLPVKSGAAPGGWITTQTRLRRTGEYAWQFPRAGTHWPDEFWRGAEVIFQPAGERARVTASRGDAVELDRAVGLAGNSMATLAPLAGAVFHVTTGAAADGTWTWAVPDDVCGPFELYVRGFCPPGTSTAARLDVAAYNSRAASFEPLARDAAFDQHDVIAAGFLREEHLDAHRRFHLRITAGGAPAWLRGVYLVPAARSGRARGELAGHISDAFAADVSARVVRHGVVAAHCRGTALLVRTWHGAPENLTPVVQCAHVYWHTGGGQTDTSEQRNAAR